jgi:hypothetical protein
VLDEKWQKDTTRRMVRLTADIRRMGMRVDCNTCHQGHAVPPALPAFPTIERFLESVRVDEAERAKERLASGLPPPAWRTPPAAVVPATPPVAAIFARYQQALGGRDAIARLTSRVARGTLATAQGQTVRIEVQQKAPDKTLTVVAYGAGLQRTIINGSIGWRGNDAQPPRIPPHLFESLALDTRFTRDLDPASVYSSATVVEERSVLNGRPMHVVRGSIANSQVVDVLYFDAATGLLARRETTRETLFGPIPQWTDFDDYRDVNGVKVPFVVHREGFAVATNSTTTRWDEVQFNVAMSDNVFERPSSPYQPPR